VSDSKRILVVGAGGPAGLGMARCLSVPELGYEVYGKDESRWGSLAMEVPFAVQPDSTYNLIMPVPDRAVLSYSQSRIAFLPPAYQLELCQDKERTARVLDDLAPKTIWVRDTKGAGGSGAQMASEYLPGRNYSVELVYNKGVLLAYFQKRRISYLVKKTEHLVTASGSSAVSICVNDPDLLSRAVDAIGRVCKETTTQAHGFYGIDFKESEKGERLITEINAGRLLTASYSYFWLTGWNLPAIGARAYFGQDPLELPDYPAGCGVIRQADMEPKLFGPEETEAWDY